MTDFKKRVKLSDLSESKIHNLEIESTGLEVDLEMNQSWDDLKIVSQQAQQAKENGEKIDVSDAGLRVLVGMIVKWNVDGKDGKPATIDFQNVKALRSVNLSALIMYVEKNSGYNTEVKKKN